MCTHKRKTNNQTEIVVLCHNSVKITQRFFRHLYENTDNFDAVFIDNGSSDSTKDFLTICANEFDNITLVLNEDNKGVIGGRNQGYDIISAADKKPKYILFIDNDQFVEPGWLDHHLSILEHGYDMVGVEAWQLSEGLFPSHKNTSITEWFSYVGCGGMLLRIEVPQKIGMFDPIFNPCYFEDPDYNWRAFNERFKIGWNCKARLVHMAHQTLGSSPDKTKNFTNSYNKFLKKWKNRPVPRMYQAALPEFSS